eukprot:symbB.v1.2.033726.t1/scaffold4228.1/size42811/3
MKSAAGLSLAFPRQAAFAPLMSRGATSVAPPKHSKRVLRLSGCVRLQPVTVLSCQRGSFATCRTARRAREALEQSPCSQLRAELGGLSVSP